jgi:SAM-dependent methyltransferase
MATERDYVLGTHDAEIVRLDVQNAVWRPYAADAWDRAGIRAGARVLDVGAGPGHAASDLAERVGPHGHVLAVERSSRFAAFARDLVISRLGCRNVAVRELDLMTWDIGETGFDAAWCRWVACFVASPPVLVRRIHDALRPRGIAVFHEYVDYASWRLLPEGPAMSAFVLEVMASWRANGGEPDIARSLPTLLRAGGFTIVSARPLVFALTSHDDMWRWPAGFVRGGARRLRELGLVTDQWIDRVLGELDEAERQPTTVMITPMVLEILAQRTD